MRVLVVFAAVIAAALSACAGTDAAPPAAQTSTLCAGDVCTPCGSATTMPVQSTDAGCRATLTCSAKVFAVSCNANTCTCTIDAVAAGSFPSTGVCEADDRGDRALQGCDWTLTRPAATSPY
jgi:hypothetical protein